MITYVLHAVAVIKFWGHGPFFICGALRVNVENSWGSGGGGGGLSGEGAETF